jgi:mercuric ion binding protein
MGTRIKEISLVIDFLIHKKIKMKALFFLIPSFGLVLLLQPIRAQIASNIDSEQLNEEVTEAFTVYGNCNMCKQRIEGVLKDVTGIFSAEWDVESKQITVRYNPDLITLNNIHKKINSTGHDTDRFQAEDKAYNDLPGCCQYSRP